MPADAKSIEAVLAETDGDIYLADVVCVMIDSSSAPSLSFAEALIPQYAFVLVGFRFAQQSHAVTVCTIDSLTRSRAWFSFPRQILSSDLHKFLKLRSCTSTV